MSSDINDTFAFMENRPQWCGESDTSSFYFRPSSHGHSFTCGHCKWDSNMSVSLQAPPISLYNHSFDTHHQNNSSTSSSLVAMLHARHGANGGMAAWTCHCREVSIDSVMSDFSGMHFGCPGLGDRMFNDPADLGPLTLILASLLESTTNPLLPSTVIPSLTTNKDHPWKTRCLRKLIIVPPCCQTLFLMMIILFKMVSFLPINSSLFLSLVSTAFIVWWKKMIPWLVWVISFLFLIHKYTHYRC